MGTPAAKADVNPTFGRSLLPDLAILGRGYSVAKALELLDPDSIYSSGDIARLPPPFTGGTFVEADVFVFPPLDPIPRSTTCDLQESVDASWSIDLRKAVEQWIPAPYSVFDGSGYVTTPPFLVRLLDLFGGVNPATNMPVGEGGGDTDGYYQLHDPVFEQQIPFREPDFVAIYVDAVFGAQSGFSEGNVDELNRATRPPWCGKVPPKEGLDHRTTPQDWGGPEAFEGDRDPLLMDVAVSMASALTMTDSFPSHSTSENSDSSELPDATGGGWSIDHSHQILSNGSCGPFGFMKRASDAPPHGYSVPGGYDHPFAPIHYDDPATWLFPWDEVGTATVSLTGEMHHYDPPSHFGEQTGGFRLFPMWEVPLSPNVIGMNSPLLVSTVIPISLDRGWLRKARQRPRAPRPLR